MELSKGEEAARASTSRHGAGGGGGDMDTTLPPDMRFTEDSLIRVVAYGLVFVLSACGNLAVFMSLCQRGMGRLSRVNVIISHLCVADLIVTFVMIPMEIVWGITIRWLASDGTCRLLSFFRAVGIYVSSFVVAVIALDRCFTVCGRTLSASHAKRRMKTMLFFAWVAGVVASVPQSIIFHVESHPKYSWYTQCVTFNFFPSPRHELAYNLFNLLAVFVVPLSVIVICYVIILQRIRWTPRQPQLPANSFSGVTTSTTAGGSWGSTRALQVTSGLVTPKMATLRAAQTPVVNVIDRLHQARIRTFKMTLVIVIAFVVCWTPYYFVSLWWWFDKNAAGEIPWRLQNIFFIFAVSNSCINPLVYGMYRWDIAFRCRLFGRDDTNIDDPTDLQLPVSRLRYRRAVRFSTASSSSTVRLRHSPYDVIDGVRHGEDSAERRQIMSAMYKYRKAVGRTENDLVRSAEI